MAENQAAERSDSELVAQTLKNPDEFSSLVSRYQQRLLRYVMRISNVRFEDAEDMVQEIFIKAYRNLNSFRQDLKFSSWLYRIAHNHVISHYRKLQARPKTIDLATSELILQNLQGEINLDQQVDQSMLRQAVAEQLRQLDQKYREVLVLRYLDGYDYREISDIIRKPGGTVATLLNRAKKLLARQIKSIKL